MQTITVRSRVGSDGVLHLDIPSNYTEADLDVTVTVRPVENSGEANWPSGFFDAVIGAWQGEPLVREPERSYERREDL